MFLFWNRSRSTRTEQQITRDRLGVDFVSKLDALHERVEQLGVNATELQEAYRNARDKEHHQNQHSNGHNFIFAFGIMAFIIVVTPIFCEIITFLISVRCFLPNNYIVLEATRPISDCSFCKNVEGPLILKNLSREEFAHFAYSSQPIIIKNAVKEWPAAKILNLNFLKTLYERVPGALDEECQFLAFCSDLKSLRDVFSMSAERANLTSDLQHPWYVGWSNCHPVILEELRKLYPRPHFLPVDAEMPNIDYIFLGYEEENAFMHLDHMPRLMWQAQLQGNKTWIVAPTPECDYVCQSFSFQVEEGDAVLVDTRIWYHGTSVPKRQFTLTIQSEYG